MDISKDETVLFVGGSSDNVMEKGVAIIQAVSLTKTMNFICDLRLDDIDHKFISKILRIGDGNHLAACSKGHLNVLEFKNKKFYKLNVIQICATILGGVTDLIYYENTIFTLVSGDTEISRIEFAHY